METPGRLSGSMPAASPLANKAAGAAERVLIKGVAIRGTLDFLKSKGGDEAIRKALDRLPEEARAAWSKTILATEYYPLEWLIALQSVACDVVGGDRRTTLRDIGRFACENALTGVYKIFVKLGSPEYFFKKSSQVFDNYFRGIGGKTMNIVEQTKGYGRVQFDGFPGGSSDYCRRLDGFFEKILELSGGKDARVIHTSCAYQGGKVCEWVGRWS